jgi:hypothetical protein
MRWILFVIDGDVKTASPDEMQRIDAFNDELRERGYFELAIGIAHPNTAAMFDYRKDVKAEVVGSVNDSVEFYSGLWVITAPDRAAAEALARRASHACNRRVELRHVLGG